MSNIILDKLKEIYEEEAPAARRQRMLPAAAYGALVGTIYALTRSLINVLTIPSLPLSPDWVQLLGMWAGFSLAFAFFGAVAAWFTEEYAGIVGGAIIFTILLAIVFLFSSQTRNATLTVQSIIMALPLIGINLLGALGLRWAARRHLAIQHEEGQDQRRKLFLRHLLTIVLVGLIPGILGRMDLPAVQSLTQLHELLQAAPNDSSVWPRLPLERVPELQEHLGVDYRLYPRQSSVSAGALDVTVRFADGFTMTCLLPVGSGYNFITDCNEGTEVAVDP